MGTALEQAHKTVLVVDDDPLFLEYLDCYSESVDADFVGVETGDDFKHEWSSTTFDLIIMDVVIPDNDAFELVDWLADRQCKQPIIFMSSYSNYLDPIRKYADARGLSVLASYAKPLEMDVVKKLLNQCN